MKICAAFCVLSLINSVWTLPTPGLSRPALKPVKGTIQTLYYSNSTTSLILNCTCANELVLWNANGSRCKVFLHNVTLADSKHPLCSACTRTTLTLTPPFVTGFYVCIGAGGKPSCHRRWFLKEQTFSATAPPITTTTSPINTTAPPINTTALVNLTQKRSSVTPILGLAAFIFILAAVYTLDYHLLNYY